jgi:hypothetical protein
LLDQLEARTGTVADFIKKGEIAIVENTVYNSLQGHYTISTYEAGQNKFILGAVYGPSCAADKTSVPWRLFFAAQQRIAVT